MALLARMGYPPFYPEIRSTVETISGVSESRDLGSDPKWLKSGHFGHVPDVRISWILGVSMYQNVVFWNHPKMPDFGYGPDWGPQI